MAGGGAPGEAMPSIPQQGSFPDPWFLLAPSALHPFTKVLHAVSYWGLPQISRVGEEIPLCLMERMGPSGSKVRGQRASKGQEKEEVREGADLYLSVALRLDTWSL